jgi:alpha-tubulin suppressor-like RCC1 family protein
VLHPHPAVRALALACLTFAALLTPSAARAAAVTTHFASIDAGNMFTCGAKSAGGVECFGSGGQGQTAPPAGLGTVKKVVAGGAWGCAIKADDSLACWSNIPSLVAIPAGVTTVTDVSAGRANTCAVKKDDGTVACWGDEFSGLGQAPPGLGAARSVSVGARHACALKTDHTVACWGSGPAATVPAGLGTAIQVTAGEEHSCAVKTDGTAVCWGTDTSGQTDVPATLGTVASVSGGGVFTCAVKTDSTVACWGAGGAGASVVPANLGTVTQLDAGYGHVCAVHADGTFLCWGHDDEGSLGRISNDGVAPPAPVVSRVTDHGNFVTVEGTADPDLAYWVRVYDAADCKAAGTMSQNTPAAYADHGIAVNTPPTGALTVSVDVINPFGQASECHNVYTRPIADGRGGDRTPVVTPTPIIDAPASVITPQLVDASPSGNRAVVVTGIAPKASAGKTVTIKASLGGHVQSTAKTKIKADGTFKATIKLATRKARKQAIYTAYIGKHKIGRLHLTSKTSAVGTP